MLDRVYLQSQPHWHATYRNTRTGRFDCLMRTIQGGFYWHTPEYDGLFAAGATRAFSPSGLADAVERGVLELAEMRRI